MPQNKIKFPTLLNFVFISSALLALLFILSEYKVSQSESIDHESFQRLRTLHSTQHKRDTFLYPLPWKIIDLEVQYVINSPVCHNANKTEPEETIFMIVLITSHAGDFEMRNNLRRILPKSELDRIFTRRLFLLAQPNPAQSESKYHDVPLKQVIEENRIHEDILMGSFLESYKNLTYKHLMGLQWVERFCSQANFVVKQDDDIFVDFYQLRDILNTNKSMQEKLTGQYNIWGKILSRQPVIRDPKSKWFVPDTELSSLQSYPPFVSGWGYVTTPKVVRKIVNQANKHTFFWIDDAFLTGIVRNNNKIVDLVDSSSTFTIYKGQMQCCVASSNPQNIGPFWCDYLVGPTNGDLQLLEFLQNHARFCHTSRLCRYRSRQTKLNSTCIITENMIVDNFENKLLSAYIGKTPENEQKGSWKIVKL